VDVAIVIEPDPVLRRVLRAYLASRGCACLEAESQAEAARLARAHGAAVVVLDVDAAGDDPAEATRRLHEGTRAGILLVGEPDHAADLARCLDAGAEDFLTKPFTARELASRLALVAGPPADAPPARPVRLGPLALDPERHAVRLASRPVALSEREYQLLTVLLRRAGHVLTVRQLARALFGDAGSGRAGAVRQLMMTLRHKIERDPARPRLLRTETGIGYRAVPRAGDLA
jgi:two-component system KDP operon response regulator KdpE